MLPILHGAFGEDGTIQKILKSHKINFIGSDEKSCEKMFYKTAAIDIMGKMESTFLIQLRYIKMIR